MVGGNQGWQPTQSSNNYYFGTVNLTNGSIAANGTATVAILDFKYGLDPGAPYPTGLVATYTQENRIYWRTLCGNQVVFSLGSNNFSITGQANPNTWKNTTPQ